MLGPIDAGKPVSIPNHCNAVRDSLLTRMPMRFVLVIPRSNSPASANSEPNRQASRCVGFGVKSWLNPFPVGLEPVVGGVPMPVHDAVGPTGDVTQRLQPELARIWQPTQLALRLGLQTR